MESKRMKELKLIMTLIFVALMLTWICLGLNHSTAKAVEIKEAINSRDKMIEEIYAYKD